MYFRSAPFFVGLVAISIVIFSGCWDNKSIQSSPYAFKSSELVEIILDESGKTSESERAIAELEKRGAWESLVKTLPPHGGYHGVSMTAIEAISAIGNVEALPYLEAVYDTDVFANGEFWSVLGDAIFDLEQKKSEDEQK